MISNLSERVRDYQIQKTNVNMRNRSVTDAPYADGWDRRLRCANETECHASKSTIWSTVHKSVKSNCKFLKEFGQTDISRTEGKSDGHITKRRNEVV